MTILNGRSNYSTLSRSLNADLLMTNDAFAVTIFPVISGYHLEDAHFENCGRRSKVHFLTDVHTQQLLVQRYSCCERLLGDSLRCAGF